MKKIISLLLLLCLIPLSGCKSNDKSTDKIQIIATLFPQYDFARQIGGDKVEVTLLLPAGAESHSYDPTPSDMLTISKSDLFIYTGDNMEPWAGDIASSVGGGVKIVDASVGATFESKEDDHDHEHLLDPHIWLDFDNAKTMCDNIYNALIEASPENKGYFEKNLNAYKEKLTQLDEKYASTLSEAEKDIIFGGKFALGYLFHRYDISYMSAYDSCSANSEPSIADTAFLANFVATNDIKAVYCQEYTDPKVAREIASYNNAEVLVIHSCHNLNKEDRENNVTFISLMEQNLENLGKGIK